MPLSRHTYPSQQWLSLYRLIHICASCASLAPTASFAFPDHWRPPTLTCDMIRYDRLLRYYRPARLFTPSLFIRATDSDLHALRHFCENKTPVRRPIAYIPRFYRYPTAKLRLRSLPSYRRYLLNASLRNASNTNEIESKKFFYFFSNFCRWVASFL